MKKIIPILLLTSLLASCNGWIIQPLPNNPPTPFLPFTQTPSFFTGTPVVIGPTVTPSIFTPAITTPTASITPITFPTFTASNTAHVPVSETPTGTSVPSGIPGISLKLLGCNTSIDITHGMGEVTNAYVTLKNAGGIQLTNLTVTLLALDPGQQVHPDQTVELAYLPIGYQVTIKLTVDTTFQKETPIQVDVTSDQGAFPREGAGACTSIGFLAPDPAGLNTPVPATP